MSRQRWEVDPEHSSIRFWVRHMRLTRIEGHFRDWSASVEWDDAAPGASQLEVAIRLGSLDTDVGPRDAQLKSTAFFDVDHFPEARFTSTRIERLGDRRFLVAGLLSLHGITREIMVDVEQSGLVWEPWGSARAGFEARAVLHRKDFAIGGETFLAEGGLVISDEVEVRVEIEAIARPEPPLVRARPAQAEAARSR